MQSKNNRHKQDRASIFLAFDALKGFKEYLRQKEKVVIAKKELSCDECEILDWKIHQLNVGDVIAVVFYCKEEYIKVEGMVSKIDLEFSKTITIVNKKINVKDIVSIDLGQGETLWTEYILKRGLIGLSL